MRIDAAEELILEQLPLAPPGGEQVVTGELGFLFGVLLQATPGPALAALEIGPVLV